MMVLVEHDRAEVPVGSEIRIKLKPDDLHVFDPSDGRAISHGLELA